MTEPKPLVRVLLVEDEPIIAMFVGSVVKSLGFAVVGPAASIDQALKFVAEGAFDCAILDVNIRGGHSYEIADRLLERNCPFVMASGYSDAAIPAHLLGESRLTKPYSNETLESELVSLAARIAVKHG